MVSKPQGKSVQDRKKKDSKQKAKKKIRKNKPRRRRSKILNAKMQQMVTQMLVKNKHKAKKRRTLQMTKRKQNKNSKQSFFKVDTDQLCKLIQQGQEINKKFQTLKICGKKNILGKYRNKMEQVLGVDEVHLYEKYFQKLDFNSLVAELTVNSFYKMAAKAKKNNKLTEKEYYRDKKSMTLQEYKSFIQDYKQNSNAVKAQYSSDYQDILFKWIQEQNIIWLDQLQEQKKSLQKKQEEITLSYSDRQKIETQLNLLKEEGPHLKNQYLEDIKDLLTGGFLIDITEENLRLMGDLLSYGFRLRSQAFLAHAKSKEQYKTSFIYLEQKKQFRHYSQATIKNSSLIGKEEYFKATNQVMYSVRESSKLLACITNYINAYCLHIKNHPEKFTVQKIKQEIKEKIQYGFFDYDYPISGITVCRDNKLKIFLNTFFDYDESGELSEKKIKIFKVFIFYTYLHEIIHYLIRHLGISEFQQPSFDSQKITNPNKRQFKKFLEISGKALKEQKMEESGRKFEMYLFGKVLDHIFQDQYDNFMMAQKNKKIDIREYFQEQEKQKKYRKDHPQLFPLLLNRTFRHNVQQNQSREIPYDCCGTKFSSKVKLSMLCNK